MSEESTAILQEMGFRAALTCEEKVNLIVPGKPERLFIRSGVFCGRERSARRTFSGAFSRRRNKSVPMNNSGRPYGKHEARFLDRTGLSAFLGLHFRRRTAQGCALFEH